MVISNTRNSLLLQLFNIDNPDGEIQIQNVLITNSSLEKCAIFYIHSYNELNFSQVNVNDSTLSSFLIVNSTLELYVNDFKVKNNTLLSSFFLFKQSDSKFCKCKLSNLYFLKNKKRSDTIFSPLLINFYQFLCDIQMETIIIYENYVLFNGNFIAIIYSQENVSLINIEMINNTYSQEAILIQYISSILVQDFYCISNNKNYSIGEACLKTVDSVELKLFNSLLLYNFGNSEPCGVIYSQTDNYDYYFYYYNPLIIIYNCLFLGNEVEVKYDPKYSGVAFHVNHLGTCYVILSLFEKNIHYFQKNFHKELGSPCIDSVSENDALHILFSTFMDNKATAASNCISFSGELLNISNSKFQSNIDLAISPETFGYSVLTFGGGVLSGADVTELFNINFTFNQAKYAGALGFYVKRDLWEQSIRAINLIFLQNRASDKGGALFLQNYNRLSWINVQYQNCNFYYNRAEEEGGVIYNHGILSMDSRLFYSNCAFLHNQGTRGGVFFNAILNLASEFENCEFSFNLATSTVDGGSVFYNDDNHDIIVRKSKIFNNAAVSRGGVIQLMKGRFKDYGSIFRNNSAGEMGGVLILLRVSEVYLEGSSLYDSKTFLNLHAFKLKFNTLGNAKLSGGTFMLMQSSMFSLNNTLVANGNSIMGGVLTIMQEAKLIISHSNFTGCSSIMGTIIYSVNSLSTIWLSNISLSNNSVKDYGLFYLLFSDININTLTAFKNNGTLFTMKDVNASLDSLSIQDHICQNLTSEGCIFSLENSAFSLQRALLVKISIYDKSIGMVFLSSRVHMSFVIFKNIRGERSPMFMRSFDTNPLFVSQCNFSDVYRQGILIRESRLTFYQNQALFEQNPGNDSFLESFIQCIDCLNCSIEESLFQNIRGVYGAVIQIISENFMNNGDFVNISFNQFLSNRALSEGGVVHIVDENVSFHHNIFKNNQAEYGGAVYLACTSEEIICKWSFYYCEFESNSASNAGGAIYWLYSYPLGEPNSFLLNTAIHGPNIASQPMKITLLTKELNSIISGQTMTQGMEFSIVDAYNQICSTLSMGQAFIAFNYFGTKPSYFQSIQGNKFFGIKEGKFKIEKLRMISRPGEPAIFLLSTNMIKNYSIFMNNSPIQPESQKNYNSEYFFEISLNFSNCSRGEIFKKIENICFKCPIGTYSFDSSFEKCLDCPPNSYCTGDEILAAENYWRESENSTVMFQCNLLKKGCPGGNFSNNCALGYKGNLCGVCIFNDTHRYFKNEFLECVSCQDQNLYVPIIILAIFSFIMSVQLYMTLRESVHIKKKTVSITVSLLSNIFFNYLEMASAVKNLVDDIPNFFKAILDYQSSIFDFDNLIGITECFLGSFSRSLSLSLFWIKHIFMCSMLALFFLSPILIGGIMKLVKGRNFEPGPTILILLITIFKVMMQPMIKYFLKNFDCFMTEKKSYVREYSIVECFGAEHLSIIFILLLPSIMIFVVFPSLMMLSYIIKHRRELHLPDIKPKVWLIVLGYKQKYFYWEFVLYAKKILLISASIALRYSPGLSALFLMLIMILSLIIHLKFKPYSSQRLNTMVFYQYFGLYSIYTASLAMVHSQERFYRLLVLFVASAANFIFFFQWIKCFFLIYVSEIRQYGLLYRGFLSLSRLLGISTLRIANINLTNTPPPEIPVKSRTRTNFSHRKTRIFAELKEM